METWMVIECSEGTCQTAKETKIRLVDFLLLCRLLCFFASLFLFSLSCHAIVSHRAILFDDLFHFQKQTKNVFVESHVA